MLLFLQLYRFYFILVPCLVQTGNCHLTLPPEILPVHLPAQPGWTPGPGSFHYGTAAGHSRPATEKKKKKTPTVRHWSDVSTRQNVKYEVNSAQKPQNHVQAHTHKLSKKLARNTYLEPFGSLMPLISVRSLSQCINTRMICLCWPVISWLHSRWWGMHLINHPTDL